MRVEIDTESEISQDEIRYRSWALSFLDKWFQGEIPMQQMRREIVEQMVQMNPGIGDETLTYYSLKGKLEMIDRFPYVIAEQYGLKIIADGDEA